MFHVACFSPGRWVGALGHKTPMLTLKLLLPCPFPLSCPLVTAASAHGDPLVHRAPAQLRALCDFLTSHRPQTRDFLSSCHMFLAQMDCFNLILMTKPGFSLCSRFWQINPLITSSFPELATLWTAQLRWLCPVPCRWQWHPAPFLRPPSVLQLSHTARTVSVLCIPSVTPIQSVCSPHHLSGSHFPTYWTALVPNPVFSSAIHLFLRHFAEMQMSKILSLSLIWKSGYFIKDKCLVRALKYLFSIFL